jgi:hypothetical protein
VTPHLLGFLAMKCLLSQEDARASLLDGSCINLL